MSLIQEWGLLSLMIFSPLVGALLLYVLRYDPESESDNVKLRVLSTVVSFVPLALSILLLIGFDKNEAAFQFTESADWIPSFGIQYLLGVDGISLFLILLTTILMPIVLVAAGSVHHRVRGYLANMLVLETAMLGTLCALDLFLFYVFWELMLFPMYFIIGVWGGERRIYASLKFVLYTVVGSLLMLAAVLYLVWAGYAQTGKVSFLFEELLQVSLSRKEQLWLFSAFALAFAIKVPLFPFHTWLPDAHVEAPTGGSVVLAGVLLKMGLYGLIRFAYPFFPQATEVFGPILALLATIGIVYGALVAWAQSDIKKLVAYSSVSHLGYCVLGFTALSVVSTTGSIYQMLNHGVSTGALFLLVGVLYDRRHTRAIAEYGGLASQVPVFAFLFLVFTLSSIALPLTNGFIGEFMILSGSFARFPELTTIAVSGVVLGAVYMLTLYMKTMFGEIDTAKNGELTDVTARELGTFLPLFILVFFMGIYPQPILERMEPSVKSYLQLLKDRSRALSEYELAKDLEGESEPQLAQNGASVQDLVESTGTGALQAVPNAGQRGEESRI